MSITTNRFLVFAWKMTYEEGGGWHDFHSGHETLDAAKAARACAHSKYGGSHIVDVQAGKIVLSQYENNTPQYDTAYGENSTENHSPMKQPTLKPLHDRILLQAPPKTDTPGMIGLVAIPENYKPMPALNNGKQRHLKAKVLAVGDACKVVKAGDEIVCVDNATYEVNVDDTTHLMVDEKMVLAVVG